MPEPLRLIEWIEAVLISAVIVLAVVGMTLLPLTSPFYVRALVTAVGSDELTGLGADTTLEAAEQVRTFVLDREAPALPESIEGRPAFDEAASSHLVDVRNVLVPSRQLALLAAGLAAAWLVIRRQRPGLLAAALQISAWSLLFAMASAAVIGLSDFNAFFAWFHGLFFSEGTWTFPADALLIRIFPLPFWTSAAATWAVLVLMSSGALVVFAHHLRVHARTLSV